MDWQEVEQAAFDFLVECVRQIHRRHPDERIYTAMFHCFYGDGEDIYFPCVSVGTEELLARVVDKYRQDAAFAEESAKQLENSLRWSGADLAEYLFEGDEAYHALAERVSRFALAQSGYRFDDGENEAECAQWAQIYGRCTLCFAHACKRFNDTLPLGSMVAADFIALANDEAMSLVPHSLNAAQLAKHFPDLFGR